MITDNPLDPPYKSIPFESNGAVAPPNIAEDSQNARAAFITLNMEHIPTDYVSRLPSDASDADKAAVTRLVEQAFNAGVTSERRGTCIPEVINREIAACVDACAADAQFHAPDVVEYVQFQCRNAFWRGMTTERKAQTTWGVYVDPATQPASRAHFFQ